MGESKKYKGSCHCGKVSYEAEMELGQVIACNCSMCKRKGSLLTFVPETSFKLLSGADNLTSYHFNRNVIDHNFCKTCGVTSFARGQRPDGVKTVAINARCLEGIDVEKLQIKNYDGASK